MSEAGAGDHRECSRDSFSRLRGKVARASATEGGGRLRRCVGPPPSDAFGDTFPRFTGEGTDCKLPRFIDSLPFRRKYRAHRLRMPFAMLREDEFDIEITTLETFVPARIGMPIKLKTKTTKTP